MSHSSVFTRRKASYVKPLIVIHDIKRKRNSKCNKKNTPNVMTTSNVISTVIVLRNCTKFQMSICHYQYQNK